ncbi:hypothetical protein CAEBREN_06991 [Caenorhabditis brenneri]|uniref:Uncharacterized protein n=1 Tax=Caenorhabditis brenneri TaxID=135651 RepID=G0NLQ4_CAEBE|nr:hypothetical protein CAEBREN_06991 [Caenorhabditis brenneri]
MFDVIEVTDVMEVYEPNKSPYAKIPDYQGEKTCRDDDRDERTPVVVPSAATDEALAQLMRQCLNVSHNTALELLAAHPLEKAIQVGQGIARLPPGVVRAEFSAKLGNPGDDERYIARVARERALAKAEEEAKAAKEAERLDLEQRVAAGRRLRKPTKRKEEAEEMKKLEKGKRSEK